MFITSANDITLKLGTSQDDNNLTKMLNSIAGGSDDKYEQGGDDKINGSDFQVEEVESKIFKLSENNTFDLDILTLVKTPVASITGILVYAYDLSDDKKPNPVRFKVDLKLTTMGSAVYMGNMSNLSLMNFLESKIIGLRIYNVQVDASTLANLAIVILSKYTT